jgi:hypothetical protein
MFCTAACLLLQPLHQSILVEGSEEEGLGDDEGAAAAAGGEEEPVGLESLLNQVRQWSTMHCGS